LCGAALSAVVTVGVAAAGDPPPADLRLEWADPPGAVEGEAGRIVDLRYRVRNVGGRAVFAAVLRAHTALGPQGRPARLEPGPRPGESLMRSHALALADGMLEVCVEGVIQNLSEGDPPDPNPGDNRVCRDVRVKPRVRQVPRGHSIDPSSMGKERKP